MRALVAALTPKVEQCWEPLKAQHVGNALYGLQKLGDSAERQRYVRTVRGVGYRIGTGADT